MVACEIWIGTVTKEERSGRSLKRLSQARDNVGWIRLVTSQEGKCIQDIFGELDPKGLVMVGCGVRERDLSR